MKTSSNSLSDADPILAEKVLGLQEEFARAEAPYRLLITSVWRSSLVQEAFYLQGRTTIELINRARSIAGLPPITDKNEAERVVTWTRASNHTIRPSRAVDLAVALDPDGPLGPIKPKIDWKDEARYVRMGKLAEKMGLVWGGRWRRRDLCHVELANNKGAM